MLRTPGHAIEHGIDLQPPDPSTDNAISTPWFDARAAIAPQDRRWRRPRCHRLRTVDAPVDGTMTPARCAGGTHNGHATVALLVTISVLTLASMAALTPAAIAPELARLRGLPTALIGVQISLVYGGAMLTSMIGGSVMRRLGACRSSQFALMLLATGALLVALPSVTTLVLGSVVIGLGYGLTNPAASHLLMRFTGARHRNLIFSLKQTGVPLGGVLAGLLAPRLVLSLGLGTSLALLASAALLLALAMQGLRARWDDDRDASVAIARRPFAGVALVWRTPGLRRMSQAALCFAAVQLCVSAYTVALLVEQLGFGLLAAGAAMSAMQVAGMLGRLLWGWLADRTRNGPATLFACALASSVGCAAVALLVAGWPPLAVTATLVLLATSAIGWNGVYLAEIARSSPSGEVATATGGSLVFTYAGVLLGPPAFALLLSSLGSYTETFGMLAAVALAAAVFSRADARRRQDN